MSVMGLEQHNADVERAATSWAELQPCDPVW
jgi:hypothetical protein